MFGLFTKADETRPQTEVIKEKIAACLAEIEALEADLPRIALECINADDDGPAKDAIDRIAALKAKEQVLTQGLVAAEAEEVKAQEAIRAREMQARRRSAAQKCGQLERASRSVSQAAAT